MFDAKVFDVSSNDPAMLVAKIGDLWELEKRAKQTAQMAAGSLVATVLPTCKKITWETQCESNDSGGFYTCVDSVTLHFSDRDAVEFPAGDDADYAVRCQFDTDAVAADVDEEASVASALYAKELKIATHDYEHLVAAVSTIVWSYPDDETFVPEKARAAPAESGAISADPCAV